METNLYKALKAFDQQKLDESFHKIADEIILGGHFEVTYKNSSGKDVVKSVYVVDVEGYFFNEKDLGSDQNDWIMYHRTHFKEREAPKEPRYFPIGCLNLHDSGIDITFENEEKGYRASMLLRSFQIVDEGKQRTSENVEDRSTYMYDALFPANYPFASENQPQWLYKIEWKQNDEQLSDDKEKLRIHSTVRKNVAQYHWDGGKPNFAQSKSFKEPQKVAYEKGGKRKTYAGDYLQDEKEWRFYDSKYMNEKNLGNPKK